MVKYLTQKQRRVLEAVIRLIRRNGYPPSLSQLAHELGVKIPTVQQHLLALQKKGHIERDKGVARGLRVVGAEGGELCPCGAEPSPIPDELELETGS